MIKKKNRNLEKNSKIKSALFICLFFIFVVLLIYFVLKIYATYSIISIKSIPVAMSVGDHVGINLDTDKLNLGTVLPNGYARRNMVVTSDVEGYVFIFGSNLDWLFVDMQGAMINKDNPVNIEFTGYAPNNRLDIDFEELIFVYILKSNSKIPLFFVNYDLLNVRFEPPEPTISLAIANQDNESAEERED